MAQIEQQTWMASTDQERWFELNVSCEGYGAKELDWQWACVEAFVNGVADEFGFADGDRITVYLINPAKRGSQVDILLQRTWQVMPVETSEIHYTTPDGITVEDM
jgi:hypothetical protein